jgi:inosine-uridine nucleoside N-ribohydrolase
MSEKVLFDTDIGNDIDDALALAYLLCEPRCELVGITTVTGQPELRAEMVSAVCRNMGRDEIPIHAGCERALIGGNRQAVAPQAAALKDWPRRTFTRDNTAIEFMRQVIRANPGEVSLLAVGPMTNVAVLFATDPGIPALLKQLVLMCGRFRTDLGGEWNAVCDPLATAITYGNTTHEKPPLHISYGLDVTTKVVLHRDAARKRFAGIRSLEPVRDFAEVWFGHSENVTFHDPLAAVGLFTPGVCEYEDGSVNVSLSEPTMGWTVPMHRQEVKPHRLAKTVNAEKFFELYFGTLR